jgi:molecular chaperone Hsp33
MVKVSEKDFMFRGVLKDHAVRFAFGNFKELTTAGILKHDTDPVAARLLGGALAAGAVMSVLLNEEERYSIRIDYAGPAAGLMMDISGRGDVRGFTRNAHVMTEVDSIEAACGDESTVTVTKSCNGKVLNSGQTKSAFILPEAALSYFLSVSDQVESEICSVLRFRPEPSSPVESAFTLMIQALPDCDLEFFNALREKMFTPEAGEILLSETLGAEEKIGELFKYLCGKESIPALDFVQADSPRFFCPCSAEKLWETAKVMLGEEDFAKLLKENPDPAIRCQFCNTEHHYPRS